MIVIPQLINYRLIIGSLVIAIIVLGSYSFVSYNTLKDQTEFLQQEQKLMETELSQMMRLYNDLESKNSTLNSQLIESKQDAQLTLDSLRLIQANESLITKYRKQIQILKNESLQLQETLNSYTVQGEEVNAQDIIKDDNKVSILVPKEEEVKLDAFEAKALMQFKSGRNQVTNKAKRVSHLEVCFSLSNVLHSQDVFIQVLNPKNNVVSDKGAVSFGNSSLIYSKKISVNHSEANETICANIESDKENRFTKGTYFVNIFNNQKLLANTTIELD